MGTMRGTFGDVGEGMLLLLLFALLMPLAFVVVVGVGNISLEEFIGPIPESGKTYEFEVAAVAVAPIVGFIDPAPTPDPTPTPTPGPAPAPGTGAEGNEFILDEREFDNCGG